MIYYQDEIIEIRDVRSEDVTDLLICRVDKALNQYDPRPTPTTGEALLEVCRQHCQAFEAEIINTPKEKRDNTYFIITSREGHFIGFTNLFSIDKSKRQGEMGIIINDRRHWNKGVAYMAMLVMMEYGFRQLELESIIVETSEINKPALGLFKKLNFSQAGEYYADDRFKFIRLEMKKERFFAR